MDDNFMCPITFEVMGDPVSCADGHSYDRAAITRWLQDHNTSPKTGMPLEHTNLVPNHALRSAIQDWQQEQEAAMRDRSRCRDQPRMSIRQPQRDRGGFGQHLAIV